jgi:hypothetical protein
MEQAEATPGLEDQILARIAELPEPSRASAGAALGWPERLRQALVDLMDTREEAGPLTAWLEQLAGAAVSQAEAALEVAFDAAGQVGRVLAGPVQECLRAEAGFAYRPTGGALRAKGGAEAFATESEGIILSAALPAGARVTANALERTVTVAFRRLAAPTLVVLIPQEPWEFPWVVEVPVGEERPRAHFEAVPPGQYLLAVYVQGEGHRKRRDA